MCKLVSAITLHLKVSFVSRGNVRLVFQESCGWVGARPLHSCSIWLTAGPGVSGVTWVSKSWWS